MGACTSVNKLFPFCFLNIISFQTPSSASASSCGYLALCFNDLRHTESVILTSATPPPAPQLTLQEVWSVDIKYRSLSLCVFILSRHVYKYMHACVRQSAIFSQEITKIIYIKFGTEVYNETMKVP
jgi:hypothetical protein